MKKLLRNIEFGYFNHPEDYRSYFIKIFGLTIYKTKVYPYDLLLSVPLRVRFFNKIFKYLMSK